MMDSKHPRVAGAPRILAGLLALATLAAAGPLAELQITGQILYGTRQAARTGAEVDVVTVYNSNPAYIRMQALGLAESDPRGKQLFTQARQAANKALATVAKNQGVDVITIPGGVQGGDVPIQDLTQQVIALLPTWCAEGPLLHGHQPDAQAIAEVDSQTVLAAIPAYLEWQALSESDARYHILRKSYRDAFAKALQRVVREQGLEVVAEKGDVTTRLGGVRDVTRDVIAVLEV